MQNNHNKELIEKIKVYLPLIDVQHYDDDDNPYVTEECFLDDDDIQEIIDLVEKEQLELLAVWAGKMGLATGHADTIESLLSEIELDIKELREKVY